MITKEYIVPFLVTDLTTTYPVKYVEDEAGLHITLSSDHKGVATRSKISWDFAWGREVATIKPTMEHSQKGSCENDT